MKTMKRGVYAALAVVLLLTAALITTCTEPLTSDGLSVPQEKTGEFVPPEGMGYVMLNFEDAEGRTIRPTPTITTLGGFTHFDVVFAPNPSGTATLFVGLDDTEVEGPFPLSDGSYNVGVWAHAAAHPVDGGGDPDPAQFDYDTALAYGAPAAALSVSAGSGTTGSIVLKEITDRKATFNTAGVGRLETKLTIGARTNLINMAITPITPTTGSTINATLYDPANLPTAIDDLMSYGVNLPPGFYTVSLTLSGSKVKTVALPEVLYIYQGMTSTYTRTLPALNTNVYDISFVYGDGRTEPAPVEVTHGSLITPPSTPTHTTSPTTLSFVAWYKEVGLSNLWNFGTEYPIKDTSLYAKWQTVGPGATATISVSYSTGTPPVLKVYDTKGTPSTSDDTEITSATPINRLDSLIIRIDVDNFSVFTAGSYRWYLDDNADDPIEDSSSDPITTSTIELDLGEVELLLAGTRTITVIATKTGGGDESVAITITINND